MRPAVVSTTQTSDLSITHRRFSTNQESFDFFLGRFKPATPQRSYSRRTSTPKYQTGTSSLLTCEQRRKRWRRSNGPVATATTQIHTWLMDWVRTMKTWRKMKIRIYRPTGHQHLMITDDTSDSQEGGNKRQVRWRWPAGGNQDNDGDPTPTFSPQPSGQWRQNAASSLCTV